MKKAKQNLLNLLLFVFWVNGHLWGQGTKGRTYCLEWAPGTPIADNDRQGFIPDTDNGNTFACAGSRIDLEYRFVDLDEGTCPRGLCQLSCPSSRYTITFETNAPGVSFIGGEVIGTLKRLTVGVKAVYEDNNLVCPPYKWLVVRSEVAPLQILNTWNGAAFDVTIRVEDVPSPLAACNTGNPVDPPFSIVGWHIEQAAQSPQAIARDVPPSPPNNVWQPEAVPGAGLIYTYTTLPAPPPTYFNGYIQESFDPVQAGGIFTMNDVLPGFQLGHPELLVPDDVAAFVFGNAIPNALAINNNNKFTDTHAGYILINGVNLTQVFSQAAINANRVGYLLPQHYESCGANLANPQIRRRINLATGIIEYNKID